MACADTERTDIEIPLTSYPRCEFFQRRIRCFTGRALTCIHEQPGSGIKPFFKRAPLLNCDTIQIMLVGNIKQIFARQDFCAKPFEGKWTGKSQALGIRVLTTAVSYANYIQELEGELKTANETDVVIVIIDMKRNPDVLEEEKHNACDTVVELIKTACSKIKCDSQIAVYCSCDSETIESPQKVTDESEMLKEGEQSKLQGLRERSVLLTKKNTSTKDDKEILQFKGVKKSMQTKFTTECSTPATSTRSKVYYESSSSETQSLETKRVYGAFPSSSIVKSRSPSTSPTKQSRPISAQSGTSPSAPRRKLLRFSPPGSDSDSDTTMSDKHCHRYHRHHSDHLDHHHHQQQQQHQQEQRGQKHRAQQFPEIPKIILSNYTQLSKNNLGQAISYSIESMLFDFLSELENKLEETKQEVHVIKEITTVDKLLFEVKGLYKQGITKLCAAKNTKNKTIRIPKELMNNVLELDNVVGFGRIYGRLSLHIPNNKDIDKVKLRTEVEKHLKEYRMDQEELVIQIMVKKPTLTCFTC